MTLDSTVHNDDMRDGAIIDRNTTDTADDNGDADEWIMEHEWSGRE